MSLQLKAKPLTKKDFSPFGDVLEKLDAEKIAINRGNCIRHHALSIAKVQGEGAQIGISIFQGQAYKLPHRLDMVERHPLGSQAFYPLGRDPWLVIVCKDEGGVPSNPHVFLATQDQGVNLQIGVWHGVLTPLNNQSDFLVVDRIGDGDNLEEYYFENPYRVDVK